MSDTQSYGNHTRWRPMFHFFLVPLLLLNILFAIWLAVRHYAQHPHVVIWWAVLAFVFFVMAGDARASALGAQDRVIRLEERLRLTTLGVPRETVYGLTERQLIGLRFASDAEAAALAERALREKLTEKQIKASVQSWKADNFRV